MPSPELETAQREYDEALVGYHRAREATERAQRFEEEAVRRVRSAHDRLFFLRIALGEPA